MRSCNGFLSCSAAEVGHNPQALLGSGNILKFPPTSGVFLTRATSATTHPLLLQPAMMQQQQHQPEDHQNGPPMQLVQQQPSLSPAYREHVGLQLFRQQQQQPPHRRLLDAGVLDIGLQLFRLQQQQPPADNQHGPCMQLLQLQSQSLSCGESVGLQLHRLPQQQHQLAFGSLPLPLPLLQQQLMTSYPNLGLLNLQGGALGLRRATDVRSGQQDTGKASAIMGETTAAPPWLLLRQAAPALSAVPHSRVPGSVAGTAAAGAAMRTHCVEDDPATWARFRRGAEGTGWKQAGSSSVVVSVGTMTGIADAAAAVADAAAAVAAMRTYHIEDASVPDTASEGCCRHIRVAAACGEQPPHRDMGSDGRRSSGSDLINVKHDQSGGGFIGNVKRESGGDPVIGMKRKQQRQKMRKKKRTQHIVCMDEGQSQGEEAAQHLEEAVQKLPQLRQPGPRVSKLTPSKHGGRKRCAAASLAEDGGSMGGSTEGGERGGEDNGGCRGGDGIGGGGEGCDTKERNRQAQHRFRERQKQSIGALREEVSESVGGGVHGASQPVRSPPAPLFDNPPTSPSPLPANSPLTVPRFPEGQSLQPQLNASLPYMPPPYPPPLIAGAEPPVPVGLLHAAHTLTPSPSAPHNLQSSSLPPPPSSPPYPPPHCR